MKLEIGQKLIQMERWIEHGEIARARAALPLLLKQKLPRRHVFALASLCRTMHFPEQAVRVLHPFVATTLDASEPEKAEYAAALNAIGCHFEAEKILLAIDYEHAPKALLFLAYTKIWQWDWEGAIAPLEQFIAHPKGQSDPKLWARINLGLALTHGPAKLVEGRKILERVCKETAHVEQRMLHKNAHLNLMQNHFARKDWNAAQESLRRLEQDFTADGDSSFESVLELWKYLVRLYKATDPQASFRSLRALRARFREQGLWENMRSCDFYEAALRGNSKLLLQLYFGTPYPAFRARVKKLMEVNGISLPSEYKWNFFQRPLASVVVVDLANGQNDLGRAFLKEGQIPLKFLQVLGRDFYKPMQMAELHELIYPKRPFNPETSANRVHQATRRLRHWMVENKIPLKIVEYKGFYSLTSDIGGLIKTCVAYERPLNTRLQRHFFEMKKYFCGKNITATELSKALGMSHRSAVRLLNDAQSAGLIVRVKRGPYTHYKIRSL